MSYKLKNTALKPPDGFWYKQPETAREFELGSLYETVEAVMVHRQINGLPRLTHEEVDEDVQDQICKRVGHQWCRNMKAEQWGFRVDWDTIKAGTKTLFTEAVRVLQGKAPWCPQPEAERRAAICAKCFANRRGMGCMSCGAQDLVRSVIAETCASVTTPSDDRLQACEVCSCLLKCKVHYPSDVLKSSMSDRQRDAYADIPECWMNDL